MATSSEPFYWPTLDPVVTEEVGTRGGAHSGMDLAANLGDPVIAPVSGVAAFVGGDGASGRLWVGYWLYPNGQGKTVDIRADNGMIVRLGHLNDYNIAQGQRVTAGDVVGFAGMTGYSTGVHVHMETRWDRAWSGGNWFNPRELNPQIFEGAPAPELIIPEEEDDMSVYLEVTSNSSPIREKDGVERSRIWAGERVINGAKMSTVWERSPDGTVRRLYAAEWEGIKAAYAAAERKLPVGKVNGNAVEQLVHGKRG